MQQTSDRATHCGLLGARHRVASCGVACFRASDRASDRARGHRARRAAVPPDADVPRTPADAVSSGGASGCRSAQGVATRPGFAVAASETLASCQRVSSSAAPTPRS